MGREVEKWITVAGKHIPIYKDADKGVETLTDNEKKLISGYVGLGNEMNDLQPERAKALDAVIAKTGDVSGDISLYRAMSIKELGVGSKSELRNNPDMIVGKTFSTRGFMSTSKTREGTGIDEFSSTAFRTALVHFVKAKTAGLDISEFSDRKDEQEVLFSRDASYKILSCKVNGNDIEIEAEILKKGN